MFFSKYIFAAMFLSTLAGGAYFYYTDTQKRILSLTSDLESYTIALQVAQSSLYNIRGEILVQQKTNTTLQINLQEAESRVTELRALFLNHNLTNLALQRPGLIETRINNGTRRVFDQLEDLTNPNRGAGNDSMRETKPTGGGD